MSLSITLHLPTSLFLAGEHPTFEARFANTGTSPLDLPDPERSRHWPKLLAESLADGQRTVRHRNDARPGEHRDMQPVFPEEVLTLQPGAAVVLRGDLVPWLATLDPGTYRLAFWLRLDGLDVVSNAVELTRLAASPDSLRMTCAHGGYSDAVVVYRLDPVQGGWMLGATQRFPDEHGHYADSTGPRLTMVAPTESWATSVTANQLPYPAQWVVGLSGGALWATFIRQGQVELGPSACPVSDSLAGATVVHPVLHDLRGNDGTTPGLATVFLRQGADLFCVALQSSQVQRVTVPHGVVVEAHPRFLRDHALRVVVLAQSAEGVAVYSMESLPAEGGGLFLRGTLAGSVWASEVSLDVQDVYHGALVLCGEAHEGVTAWSVVRWRWEGAHFALGAPAALVIPDRHSPSLRQVLLGVDPEGQVTALVQEDGGGWWLERPGHGFEAWTPPAGVVPTALFSRPGGAVCLLGRSAQHGVVLDEVAH